MPERLTADPFLSWSVWTRKGRGRWRLFGRAPTEQAAEELARKVEVGRDKLICQGGPNTEDQRG